MLGDVWKRRVTSLLERECNSEHLSLGRVWYPAPSYRVAYSGGAALPLSQETAPHFATEHSVSTPATSTQQRTFLDKERCCTPIHRTASRITAAGRANSAKRKSRTISKGTTALMCHSHSRSRRPPNREFTLENAAVARILHGKKDRYARLSVLISSDETPHSAPPPLPFSACADIPPAHKPHHNSTFRAGWPDFPGLYSYPRQTGRG
jgi:hypothetical protein